MKLTAHQLVLAQEMFKRLKQTKLPVADAFQVNCLIASIEPHLEAAQAAFVGLHEKHGVRTTETVNGDDVTTFKVQPEAMEQFRAELLPFLATEVEVSFSPVPLRVFESLPSITPEEAGALAPFVAA